MKPTLEHEASPLRGPRRSLPGLAACRFGVVRALVALSIAPWVGPTLGAGPSPAVLPGTEPLAASHDGLGNWHAVIQGEVERAVAERGRHWNRDFGSADAYNRSVETNRARLARILGMRDARVPFGSPEWVGTVDEPALVARGAHHDVLRVRWPVLGHVNGEGLLLEPRGRRPVAGVVAIPDCAHTPEQVCGVEPGVAAASQFARRLAESGCRVLVPTLIDRTVEVRGRDGFRAYSRQPMSSREFLFRPAYQLGRHLIGYEVQKVLAAVDWLGRHHESLGVFGHGEGGLVAFHAAALDTRIDAAVVSAYIEARRKPWTEPFDRAVFSWMTCFGDAEVATLILPRTLVVEACRGPEVSVASPGGSTGVLRTPPLEAVKAEVERARELAGGFRLPAGPRLVVSGEGQGAFGTDESLAALLGALSPGATLAREAGGMEVLAARSDARDRQQRQMREIERHNQALLAASTQERAAFMAGLDSSSVERHEATRGPYVEHLRAEVLGRLEARPLPVRARTRLRHDEARWACYEVQIDAYPGAHAFGYLVVPKDIPAGERRPVVVCQHGGGGHPEQLVRDQDGAYHAFAARLAEEGFVTFSPQVMFPPPDGWVRQCNSVGLTQYSYVAAMHQRVVDWLRAQPFVEPGRIGLYGLSWGGKTAMRIPLLVDGYALTVVSGDFNEWTWKTTTTDSDYSYVFQPEPYIFEFHLGATFGYAEMAALIAPRPFMVERGHDDPVGTDEQVGLEFAKVRRLYEARLRLPGRCEIEWFVGGHEIHGEGTFRFLRRHLGREPRP